MKLHFKPVLLAVAATAIAAPANATLVISLNGGDFLTSSGNLVSATALFQLVNLGNNGVFDQIDVSDGSTAGLAQWTSGDDSVLDIAIIFRQPKLSIFQRLPERQAFWIEYSNLPQLHFHKTPMSEFAGFPV